MKSLFVILLGCGLAMPALLVAQEANAAAEGIEAVPRAPVKLDGESLFLVRGLSAYPAEDRAKAIAERIRRLAEDPAYHPGSIELTEHDGSSRLTARGIMIMVVTSADAAAEGVSRQVLTAYISARTDQAIEAYRAARTPAALWQGALRALITTAVALVSLVLFLWLYRRLAAAAHRFCRARVERVQLEAVAGVDPERLWNTLDGALRTVRTVTLAAALLLYVNLMLGLFPWTRPFSSQVFELVLGPLRTMGANFARALPDLVFLLVLFYVIRLVLKLTRMFFDAVERGSVELSGFDPEWSGPTFRIVRVLIVAFGLVVAYPYLPGSGSEAFKGVSLFVGVVFSLGSTGLISNLLAGYSLTYRRAYRIGDRVRIGDVTGDVEHIRLQVTHLRSVKNEEIIVPNSVILNSNVINYSSLARSGSLILYTTVGIGYETPWRQVEAMLQLAAARTPGLRKEPPPFVHQKALGDFCVTYELNVHTDQPQQQAALYTELHRHILDVFNEYGVQIMTPAYEGDPAEPKVVRKEDWFASPASPPQPVDRA